MGRHVTLSQVKGIFGFDESSNIGILAADEGYLPLLSMQLAYSPQSWALAGNA